MNTVDIKILTFNLFSKATQCPFKMFWSRVEAICQCQDDIKIDGYHNVILKIFKYELFVTFL